MRTLSRLGHAAVILAAGSTLLPAEAFAQGRSLSTPVRHSWELIREQSPVS